MSSDRSTSRHSGRREAAFLLAFVLFLVAMAVHAQARQRALEPAVDHVAELTACALLATKRQSACMDSAIGGLLEAERDLPMALQQINAAARRHASLARRCHMIMHEHGRTHRGSVDPSAVDHDGKDCAAGFLHGWMMANLGSGGSLDRGTIASWCAVADTALERADCEHGMGHVLVRNLDGDLPTALRRCRALGSDAFLRNCAGGAYMENRAGGRGRDAAAATTQWQRGRPWRPCATAPRELVDACAAWAVRDVEPARRLAWCRSQVPAAVEDGPCRIAVGVVARLEQPARAACGTDDACWYGRGYAWATLGWEARSGAEEDAAARRCLAGRAELRQACAAGVGFRRAATLPLELEAAQAASCDAQFVAAARAACRAGAALRDAPVAYA